MPAFKDVLDATTDGLCGAKVIVLDPSATTDHFLEMEWKVNPIRFAYDATATTEADIGTHTVAYTVTHFSYSSVRTAYASSFTFTVNCPTLVF